jgi:hypothetical protein
MNRIVSTSTITSASIVPSEADAANDLIELFAQLWRAFEHERSADYRFEAQSEAREELIGANQTWPDNQDQWTREDAQAYWKALCEAEPKTDLNAAQDAYFAATELVDSICKKIIDRYPSTVQALAAQALMAGRVNPKVWQYDDYEDKHMQALFAGVFAAAGVECPFQFDARP